MAQALLFPDFLEREGAYRACENYWRGLIRGIEDELGQRGGWPRWMPTTWGDGTPQLDGDPIYQGYCKHQGRAFKIIQTAPADGLGIVAWLKNYADDPVFDDRHGDAWPPIVLVVGLCLSEETAEQAVTLIKEWMTPDTSLEQIERSTAKLVAAS
jgi:hypothetical protein